jgi:hypothetical protein
MEHANDSNWTIFVGNHIIVDSLLNKPLLRAEDGPLQRIHSSHHINLVKLFLRILIATQWGLIVAASALQNWNAFIISAAIVLCALTSTFIDPVHDSVASWLQSNSIGLEKMTTTLSGRRAMLSAMIAVSPDRSTRWIDPILAPCDQRTSWEHELAELLRNDIEPTGKFVGPILEGVEKATQINKWLLEREACHREPSRPPDQKPYLLPSKSLQSKSLQSQATLVHSPQPISISASQSSPQPLQSPSQLTPSGPVTISQTPQPISHAPPSPSALQPAVECYVAKVVD